MRYLTTLTLALLAGVALAQELPPIVADPSEWFKDALALAAVVFALTALIKGRFNLHELATLGVSYASGVIIAVAFSFTPFYSGVTLGEAVVYGLSAATLASGGREGVLVILAKAFSWLGPATPPQPVTGEALPGEAMPESREDQVEE